MGDSLFDIFGDHITRQVVKNVSRQPFSNIENMGKTVSTGSIKSNEPLKKGDTKKSFFSNAAKALQSTPMRQVFTPIDVGPLIYNDETENETTQFHFSKLEFTKPSYRLANDYRDILHFPSPPTARHDITPPNTPPPSLSKYSMEFDCTCQDGFFTDDFSIESFPNEDLGLPQIY